MKTIIYNLGVFLTCSVFIFACCKKTTTTPPVVVSKCDYKGGLTDVNFPFKDTGNISSANVGFINLIPANSTLPDFFSQNIGSTLKADIAAQNWDSCQVKDVLMNNFRVTIDSPALHNFDFLDTITIKIANLDNSNIKLVAYKYGVPKNSNQIIMNVVPDFNLKSYFLKDSFKIFVGGTKSASPNNWTSTTYFSFDAGFKGQVYTQP
jgi:hypothetical protein